MGGGRPRFKRHWHHRSLELADGDALTWLVVDRSDRDPFIAYFRNGCPGGVHEDDRYRLLAERDHPDAGIPRCVRTPGAPSIEQGSGDRDPMRRTERSEHAGPVSAGNAGPPTPVSIGSMPPPRARRQDRQSCATSR
jgi:hypothetical protein